MATTPSWVGGALRRLPLADGGGQAVDRAHARPVGCGGKGVAQRPRTDPLGRRRVRPGAIRTVPTRQVPSSSTVKPAPVQASGSSPTTSSSMDGVIGPTAGRRRRSTQGDGTWADCRSHDRLSRTAVVSRPRLAGRRSRSGHPGRARVAAGPGHPIRRRRPGELGRAGRAVRRAAVLRHGRAAGRARRRADADEPTGGAPGRRRAGRLARVLGARWWSASTPATSPTSSRSTPPGCWPPPGCRSVLLRRHLSHPGPGLRRAAPRAPMPASCARPATTRPATTATRCTWATAPRSSRPSTPRSPTPSSGRPARRSAGSPPTTRPSPGSAPR